MRAVFVVVLLLVGFLGVEPLAGQNSPDSRNDAEAVGDGNPPVTVQPGAPGEPTRTLDSAALAEMERPAYTEADARFIQRMIRHHVQALEMVDLLRERTDREDLLQLGLRIEISQEDEIELMERWLRQRDEGVPDVDSTTATAGASALPPGMLTPGQMASLENESDRTFELRFLELMIEHHEGALEMVDRLFGSPGAGQVPSVFHIAAEVQADQSMEIQRMREMLEEVGR